MTDESHGHPLDGVWVSLASGLTLNEAAHEDAARAGARGLIATHAVIEGAAQDQGGPTGAAHRRPEDASPEQTPPVAAAADTVRRSAGGTASRSVDAHESPAPLTLDQLPLPVRVDIDPARLRVRGPALLQAAHALGPDLIGLPVGAAESAELHGCLDLAEAEGIELVLLVGDPREASLACALAGRSDQVVGFSLSRHDEDALELLSNRDDLGLLSAAPEFASAFRRGAGGLEGFPASMSPPAAVWLLELCVEDVGAALGLERRLLRFLEGQLRPALRRLEAQAAGHDQGAAERALHAAVGGWPPSRAHGDLSLGKGVDPLDLRRSLLEEVPELARFLS